MPGLYVPLSEFKQSAKDIVGSATEGGSNVLDNSYGGNGIKGWASQAAQNASTKVMSTIGKFIKKNRVKLKYGTKVYLVDGSAQERAKRQEQRERQSQRRQFNTATYNGDYARDAYSDYE